MSEEDQVNRGQEQTLLPKEQSRLTAERRMRDLQTAWSRFDVGPVWPLDRYGACLRPFTPERSRSALETVPIGMLHSHQIWQPPEVAAFEYSDGIRLIAVDYRFINFVYLVDAFLLSQVLAEEEGDTSLNTAQTNARAIVSQFARFDTRMGLMDVQMCEVESLPQKYREVHNAWLDAQHLFLVGHEYAHFILGHLGPSRMTPVEIGGQEYVLPGGITLGLLARTQGEELHADHQGAAMAINAILADKNLTEFGRDMSIAGIDVFFRVLQMMDHILFEDTPSSTHPSGHTRHLSWREHFSGRLIARAGEAGRWAESFLERVDAMYDSGEFDVTNAN